MSRLSTSLMAALLVVASNCVRHAVIFQANGPFIKQKSASFDAVCRVLNQDLFKRCKLARAIYVFFFR